MSLGTWDPSSNTTANRFEIDSAILQRFIALSQGPQLEQLAQQLSKQEQQTLAPMMQLEKDQWFAVAEKMPSDEIIALMRFFTLAEQLPGWEAGAKSPVIWLGKILKKRGEGISKELQLWIKAASNNQFLPHGSLL